MKLVLLFLLFFIGIVYKKTFLIAVSSNIYKSGKLTANEANRNRLNGIRHGKTKPRDELEDIEKARKKAEILEKVRNYEKRFDAIMSEMVLEPDKNEQRYRKDPILNMVKRRYIKTRRDKGQQQVSTEGSSSSSSLELPNWKDEWKEHWLHKKLEAINSSMPRGDMVNMVAARPWGVPCGDPNQHDLPWGSCMLPMECEAEYRIYRGDYFCGRTKFICCALQMTNYDLYGGFDVSFADSSLATDSEEKKNKMRGSKERRRRKKIREKKKRRRQRMKRKRRIKRTIKKIIREIRKILNRSFRNGTTARKRKTKQLKKYIKEMKQKYLQDRKAVKDIHELELVRIDAALKKRLNEIRGVNQEFIYNETFRDIIVNGTIKKENARMLKDAYPELRGMFNTRRRDSRKPKDYLEYDIEYGYLYYE